MATLLAHGITSRMVGFYRDADNAPTPAYTHASVDVFVGGNWIALAPYFNIAFQDDNARLLGWQEVVERTSRGAPPKVVPGLQFKGQTIADYERIYSTKFHDLTRFVVFTPVGSEDIVTLNPEWDGILRYADGTTFDAYASARWPFFRTLTISPPGN